ncbi:MAG TPA: LuxR C-terminal-related transcriptional regulator [Candidatus Acidoferrales bacterium]|nr:LuxR C-terminal-related transcriptional regulator [Candidatus Acidoferrales bacterium]
MPRTVAPVGLVLVDAEFTPLRMSAEAVRVLSYPNQTTEGADAPKALADQVRSRFSRRRMAPDSAAVQGYKSGRRRYLCRVYRFGPPKPAPGEPAALIVLERDSRLPAPDGAVMAQFQFTPREEQVVRHVLAGLSNKQIAERMQISPNTVKAFLRLAMMKMGVSNRFKIVEKILLDHRTPPVAQKAEPQRARRLAAVGG